MISSFGHYVKTGKVKKKTPDPEEGKALLNQAQDRLEYIKGKEITAKTAKFVFEDAYEALQKKGIAVLWDDRETSQGEKLAAADLLGIPIRAVISEKTGDRIEIKKRNSKEIILGTVADLLHV